MLRVFTRGITYKYKLGKISLRLFSNTLNVLLNVDDHFDFQRQWDPEEKQLFLNDMTIVDNFISSSEEDQLFNEIEPYLKRMKYEFDHWDGVIIGYRETERKNWQPENKKIIERVQNFAIKDGKILSHIHVLDLSEDGEILPHVDNVRFCGTVIAGISLLSDSIMRFAPHHEGLEGEAAIKELEHSSEPFVDVLLKRQSLYVIKNKVRYDYTHQILSKSLSKFKSKIVEKSRRISVICRNEP